MLSEEKAATRRRHLRLLPGVPPVLRLREFRRYWSAATVSLLGDGVSSVAVPLTAALYLHADAAQMGYLTALIWAPSLLFAIPAGIWADRASRTRAMMVGADLGRALLLSGVPVSGMLHVLNLPELYAVVFATGTLSVLFEVCDIALFAALVPEARYVEGQSLVYGSQSMASLAGPSLGGAIAGLLSAPVAVAADAVSFLCSAAFLSSLPAAARPRQAGRGEGSRTGGLRFIGRTPVIRTALEVTATVNFFTTMFNALLVVYLSQDLHFSPGCIGMVLGSAAVGGLSGAMLTARIAKAVGLGGTVLAGSVLVSAPLLLVPLASGTLAMALTLVLIASICSGAGRSMQNISVGSVFASTVPRGMISQVKGAYQMVSIGSRPLGALLGGTLGSLAGVRLALLLAAVGGALSWIWVVRSPLLGFRIPVGDGELESARGS